jgi:hypothetical protein
MSRYLDTSGSTVIAIAVCDRCRTKVSISDLVADRNIPGLRVCEQCNDEKDPYRLPARRSEKITLRYPRPDEPLS